MESAKSEKYTYPELIKLVRSKTGKSLGEITKMSEAELMALVPSSVELVGPKVSSTETPLDQLIWQAVSKDVGSQLVKQTEEKVIASAKKVAEETSEKVGKETATKVARSTASKAGRDAAIKALRERMPNENRVVVEFANDSTRSLDKPVHKQLAQLLYWVAERENVYLYSPPGTGKTTAPFQVAELLNLNFGYISLNPQTAASALMGYRDINGHLVKTLFRECYEHGGVFLVDEIDNGADTLLTSLNGALDNGMAAFPDRVVSKHKDFVCIATGNTAARGGNIMHSGRRAFDGATIDRFVFVRWEYDEDLEAVLVKSIYDHEEAIEFMNWVRAVRAFCEERQLRLLASPRASFRGARALKRSSFTVEEIADQVLFKGIDDETRRQVLNNCALPVIKR